MRSLLSTYQVRNIASVTCLGGNKSDLLEAAVLVQEVDDEHHSYSHKSKLSDTRKMTPEKVQVSSVEIKLLS